MSEDIEVKSTHEHSFFLHVYVSAVKQCKCLFTAQFVSILFVDAYLSVPSVYMKYWIVKDALILGNLGMLSTFHVQSIHSEENTLWKRAQMARKDFHFCPNLV